MDIGGISTGIDVAGIVEQLMSIERLPLSNYQIKQQIITQKSAIYTDIKTRIGTLGTTASELTNESAFDVFSAAYSEESVISASVGASASSGSYKIIINNLAAAHTVGSDRQTDDESVLSGASYSKASVISASVGTTAVNGESYDIVVTQLAEHEVSSDVLADDETALGLAGVVKINGKDVAISVDDTLVDIMNTINGTADIGVDATIAGNVLNIKMSSTGSSPITFVDDAGGSLKTLGILDGGDAIKNVVVAASNASFTVDGELPISSASNVVSDVISGIAGVTMTLIAEDATTLTVKNLSGNITINGKDVAIGIGDTLVDIMAAINSTTDVGVEATIVDNVLKLKMSETGVDEIILVDNANGALKTLGILTAGNEVKNEFVPASDASFSIDGQTISRTSNEISDVITGVTLTLVKEDPLVPVTLTISRNKSAVITKIQNLINQYNSVVDLIYTKTTEKKVVPPLTDADRYKGLASGDQFLDGIRYEMAALMSGIINGMEDDFDSLAKIGITRSAFVSTSNNTDLMVGKLSIDIAILTTAMDEDFENVKDMFISNANTEDLESEDYGISVRVKNYVDSLTNIDGGYFATKSAGFSSETTILTNTIENFNRRMVVREAMLKAKYVRLDVAMAQSDTQSQWLTAQLGSL